MEERRRAKGEAHTDTRRFEGGAVEDIVLGTSVHDLFPEPVFVPLHAVSNPLDPVQELSSPILRFQSCSRSCSDRWGLNWNKKISFSCCRTRRKSSSVDGAAAMVRIPRCNCGLLIVRISCLGVELKAGSSISYLLEPGKQLALTLTRMYTFNCRHPLTS